MEGNLPITRQFLLATGLETSVAFGNAAFTTGELGLFSVRTLVNQGATPTLAGTDGSKLFYAEKVNPAVYLNKASLKSSDFKIEDIERLVVRTYAAAVPQIWTVGYDGSDATKTLGYDCETQYGIKVSLFSPFISKWYGMAGLTHTVEITTNCCTPCDAGCGSGTTALAETWKFVRAFDLGGNAYEPYNPNDSTAFSLTNFIGVEMITSTADGSALSGTATVTQNSVTVTFSANQTIVAGTYVRIGSGVTKPVYKVATGASTSKTITLDVPYQGTTAAGVSVYTPAPATSDSYGLKLTGKFIQATNGCCCFPPFPFDAEGVTMLITDSLINSFPCSFVTTKLQDLNIGTGSGYQVQYDEMDALGYSDKRLFFKDCALNFDYIPQVSTSTNYDEAFLYFKTPVTHTGEYSANLTCLIIVADTSSNLASGTINTSTGALTSSGAVLLQLGKIALAANAPIEYNGTQVTSVA